MAINEFKSRKTHGKSCSKTQTPSKRKSGLQTKLYQLSGIENQQGFLEVSFKVPPTPSPSLKLTRRFSISPTRTFTSSRLSQDPEKFNYEVISIKEEERDDSEDEGNEISNHCRESGFSRQKSDKDASLGLLKRKFSLKIQAEVLNLEDRELMPRFTFKTNSRFCDRAIYLKNSDLPKHFCDILGPGMCADCMKARKQQANISDFVESFPDISVSPYQLCVPPENDSRKSKTPTQVYKDCDALLRKRSMSRLSAPDGRTTGTPARPNSSVGQNDSLRSLGSSPVLSYMSGHSRGLSAYSNQLPVSSPEPDSRRTSIARYIDNTLRESEKPHEWNNRKFIPRSAVKARGSEPKFERQHSDLHQNVFHKAISVRMRGTRSSRTPAIERRGKLSEVSYWRFLIPEPPVMEVGRMNVSIYTPKDLPGIKIFDESLFDI